jgi:predicted amidophosphoribosyltransferase
VTYNDLARRFLLRGKDGHRPELLRQLAGQLASTISVSEVLQGVAGIVPVPSSSLSRWRRGFDPASVLARELAALAGVPLWDGVLRRRRLAGPAAKALGAPARRAWAQGAFAARARVPEAPVLLVDDVLTTGATASACAAALRSAGAREVRVAVWARTPSPGTTFDRSSGTPL